MYINQLNAAMHKKGVGTNSIFYMKILLNLVSRAHAHHRSLLLKAKTQWSRSIRENAFLSNRDCNSLPTTHSHTGWMVNDGRSETIFVPLFSENILILFPSQYFAQSCYLRYLDRYSCCKS